MICRQRPGALDIRSVSGDLNYQVDLGGEMLITGAALDEAGNRLVLTGGYEVDSWAGAPADPRLLLIDLRTSQRALLHEGPAHGPVWLPDGNTIAFSSGTEICLLDLTDGSLRRLYRFSSSAQGPAVIGIRPDGTGLAFLKWVGDDHRICLLDLDTGEGRDLPVSCYSYSWCDARTILYALGAGIRRLHINTGNKSTLLRDMAPLALSGALEAVSEEWAELVQAEGGFHEIGRPLCSNGRIFFAAHVAVSVQRPSWIPFVRSHRVERRCGVFSMGEDMADLQLHFQQGDGRVMNLVLLNEGETLAIHIEARGDDGYLTSTWLYAGQGAESIPTGFGPLPRAASSTYGDVPVGGFGNQWRQDTDET